MSNGQDELVRALYRLQISANRCASTFTSDSTQVDFRVAFSAGAALPWRLIETHRAALENGTPRLLRRMHCFRSAQSLEHSIEERTGWKMRDQSLVRGHFVQVGSAQPLEGSQVDLLDLTATRQALRAQMCLTRPERVIDLPSR
jgi:hypothetical protein